MNIECTNLKHWQEKIAPRRISLSRGNYCSFLQFPRPSSPQIGPLAFKVDINHLCLSCSFQFVGWLLICTAFVSFNIWVSGYKFFLKKTYFTSTEPLEGLLGVGNFWCQVFVFFFFACLILHILKCLRFVCLY